ncbi:MAG: hypothetical protein V4719_05735 [Planctomycetota bacterium]
MSKSHSAIIGMSVVVGCLILGAMSNSRATGESSVSPPASGKYQLVVTEPASGVDSRVFVFDPATGQCWVKSTNLGVSGWRDLGSPVLHPGQKPGQDPKSNK